LTRNYELVVVLSGQLTKEALAQKLQELQAVVERFQGTVTQQDEWGKRTLAYEIDGNKEGYYTLFKVEMDSEKVRELDRMLRIREDLLRFIIVREEEKPKKAVRKPVVKMPQAASKEEPKEEAKEAAETKEEPVETEAPVAEKAETVETAEEAPAEETVQPENEPEETKSEEA